MHVAQYFEWFLKQVGVAVHREQELPHLYVIPYNVSHALYIYIYAKAAFKFLITL